jgi:hypothetical protein
MQSDLSKIPGVAGYAHVADAPAACFFDSELHLMPGVTIPLRSMLIETERDAILISPVGSNAERSAIASRPTVLVAPSLLHHKHLVETRERAPIVSLWGPKGLAEKRPELAGARVFGRDPWPYGEILPFVAIEGAPKRNEIAFFHPPSRTLYTADLVFAISEPKGFLTPLTFRAMGIYKRFAMARSWERWVEDRIAFRRSIEELLAWDFDRIAMAHGDIVERGGRQRLIEALRERELL